ncbi:MAG: hypothetical protein IMZ52_09975 [Actinobacteria bacterium]|nr:hypothetical protein [Actinomycetota bacterium]
MFPAVATVTAAILVVAIGLGFVSGLVLVFGFAIAFVFEFVLAFAVLFGLAAVSIPALHPAVELALTIAL